MTRPLLRALVCCVCLLSVVRTEAQDSEPAAQPAAVESQPSSETAVSSAAPAPSATEVQAAPPPAQALPVAGPTAPAPSEASQPRGIVHGGYGGPQLKLTRILEEPGLLIGGGGGWLINHSCLLGLAGYGLATQNEVPVATRADGVPSHLTFGYGGLWLAYFYPVHRLVHVGAGAIVAAGGVGATTDKKIARTPRGEKKFRNAHGDSVFVLEPELSAEVTVVRFMRIALSASYRYVGAVDAPGLTSKKLSGVAGGLMVKFGSF